MTNETRQRIKFYQEALPNMKEKVIAAAMMLIIAISVTVTSTYAWITLSTAPEVTSVDTTVVANGSLEIALANGTGKAPGKSAVGDSSATEGSTVRSANITWGNLVNLSDPTYGMAKITLRPAALNGTSGLLTNPLYGVGYGEDGRVSSMVTDDDFAYVYYDATVNGGKGAFMADLEGNHMGVRAISTVKYENVEGQEQLTQLLKDINQNLTTAKNNYASMTNEGQDPGKTYIQSLEGLIQIYAQSIIDKRFSGGGALNTLNITQYVPDLYDMMVYFKENIMTPVGESYLQMANLLDVLHEDGSHTGNAGYEDVNALLTAVEAGSLKEYEKNNLKGISGFAADYSKLAIYLLTDGDGGFTNLTNSQKQSSLAYWAYYATNGGTVYWTDIQTHINWICDINSATLDSYTLSSLSSMSVALKVLGGASPHNAVINGGAIYRMEKRIGQHMSPTISVTVDASAVSSLVGKVPMEAILTTSASDPYDVVTDRDQVKSFNTGSFKGDTATAEDTYAMAIDLWLRTNAGSSGGEETKETIEGETEDGSKTSTTITTSMEQAYLTLEGTVVMQEKQTQATIRDLNGDEQPVYIASFTINGETGTKEVFKRYGYYYYISKDESGKEIEVSFDEEIEAYGELVTEITYNPKVTTTNEIVGYEGVNHVWDEEQMAGFEGTGTSATQGRGSCYVFYADTPADQSRFLELLGSMKVVFVNAQGKQIGTASLDTENYFAETGKTTVPLVLDKTNAINLGTDINGKTTYGLMPLTKNAATRVTALIYLDGTKLTNDMVLASGDIQGTLNIQFGSSTALKRTTITTTTTAEGEITTDTEIDYVSGTDSEAIKDEPVMNQFVELSARISPTGPVDYDPQNKATTTLSIDVIGVEPGSVSAQFIRKISSTQGVLQDPIVLEGSGSDWSTQCSFDKPGTYVLRSVWVDGVEYGLNDPVEFTVTGSSVTSLGCDAIKDESGQATIMTANNSFSTKMVLGFSSSNAVPSSVNGIFMDEKGRQVNVPFYLEGGSWQGTAKFTTSGTFTMKYVEIDGDIYELSDRLQPTLEILLGLKVRTWISADNDTLKKLQQVLATALATNFVLDKTVTGDVTLNVSSEIYDNSGEELTGLSNVKLYYGRVGSAVSTTGLDSNMAWNSTTGRYEGAFKVTTAGTFRFHKLTIGTSNTVERYTEAPSIQVMPPDDAYYYDNVTPTYQYAPDLDAAMLLRVAYSDAVSRVNADGSSRSGMEATITNGTSTTKVDGDIVITEDIEGKSITTWSFMIPKTNGSQEDDWVLTDITMYNVYYDGKYYDGEQGITLDLTDKNIQTKVANYLYVTLNTGADESRSFTGDFMADHIVDDITVEIADFEGNAIDTLAISDVKVVYTRDAASSTLANYGYEMTEVSNVTVDGAGTLMNGSTTKYQIGTIAEPVNFKYVGLYKSCSVSFKVDDLTDEAAGSSVTAGAANSGTKISYTKNGALSDALPAYEVKWNAPDVKITGISPAYGTKKIITSSNDAAVKNDTAIIQTEVTNWVSTDKYAAVVYLQYDNDGARRQFYKPSVTLTLSNIGSDFSSVLLEVPKGVDANTTQKYSFVTNEMTVTKEIGEVSGVVTTILGVTRGSTTHNEIGKQQINTVTVEGNDDVAWIAKLSRDIVINQQPIAPEISFDGLSTFSSVTTPTTIKTSTQGITLSQDGSNSFTCKLPVISDFTESVAEDAVPGTRQSVEETSSTHYYKKSWGDYRYYTLKTTTYKTPYVGETFDITYKLSGWVISREDLGKGTTTVLNSGKVYAPGAEFTLEEGNYRYTATAVVEEVTKVPTGKATKYYYEAETTWSGSDWSLTEPSGTKYDSAATVEAYLNSQKGTRGLYWKDN